MYVHCLKIYNLFVRALETCRKARYLQPVSQRVQINRIFNDNICMLCLSCNFTKCKSTTKLSENSWNKHCSNCFWWCLLWRQRLYCYRFFLSLYMKQVSEMPYEVYDYITVKFIRFPWLVLKITQLQYKSFYMVTIRKTCFRIRLH